MLNFLSKLKATWEQLKNWSGWSVAGSIFMARMEAFSGFLIAVFGGLDWGPIISLDFTTPIKSTALLSLGVAMGLKSVIAEVVRRANANFNQPAPAPTPVTA